MMEIYGPLWSSLDGTSEFLLVFYLAKMTFRKYFQGRTAEKILLYLRSSSCILVKSTTTGILPVSVYRDLGEEVKKMDKI